MVKAKDVYGARYGQAKLEPSQVQAVRRRLDQGEAQRAIAKRYGVSQAEISLISSGKRWRGK